MSNEEDYIEDDYFDEEDRIKEGHCDDCGEYGIYGSGLTKCPEHGEEVKRNCWRDYSFCTDCCKNALDDHDCEGSCGMDFVEEHRKSRFIEICNNENLVKYDDESFTNSEKTILVAIGEFKEKYEKNPIAISTPFLMGEYAVIRNDDELHIYKREYFEFLDNFLRDHFNEDPRYFLQSEKSTAAGKMYILKLEGDFVSGLISPRIDDSAEERRESKLKMIREFSDYMTEGITIFNVGKEIEKYCLVTQDYCKFNINHKGKDSYFAAYPFNPNKWPRFINRLKKELQKKGIDVILPIDLIDCFPDTGILFCKLCKMIYSTNSIISEVTQINQNVMFEAGYALGLGKFCYFLIDESFDSRKRISNDLISDLQHIYYLDASQCSTFFKQKEEDIQHLLPKRKPKITGGCEHCNKVINHKKNSILLLIPEDQYHKEVVETKIKSLLDKNIYDVSKLTGHPVCNYCVAIQENDIIIGDFVSDDFSDKDAKNSKISFLLGLSLAMEKKILILQQAPFHQKIIDFGKMSRNYIDEDEVDEIIKSLFVNDKSMLSK